MDLVRESEAQASHFSINGNDQIDDFRNQVDEDGAFEQAMNR